MTILNLCFYLTFLVASLKAPYADAVSTFTSTPVKGALVKFLGELRTVNYDQVGLSEALK